MADKTVEIKGLEELVKLIGKFGNLKADIYEPVYVAFGQAGKLLEAQIKQNLTDNDSVGLGDLRGKISSSEAQISEKSIFVEVGAGGVPYAEYVEYGTGPAAGRPAYTPPISITEPGQPLYKWVEVKQMAGVYSLKTGKRLGTKQQKMDETQKVARAIWAGIRKKGTRPHPYFYIALEQKRDEINQLFAEAVDKLVEQLKG